MSADQSPLQRARSTYRPSVPGPLREGPAFIRFAEGAPSGAVRDADAIRQAFPGTFGRPALVAEPTVAPLPPRRLRVGVVLSGGQAPGGHNVITGLFDAIRRFDAGSSLVGFLGGPKGIFTARYRELDASTIEAYRNTGGFDLIGGGRDKIETTQQLEASRVTCETLDLDGLVVIGGDDSNTNAATLAEYFVDRGVQTIVVGVPKTIDGDLKGHGIECSFGFDTATKVYAELIGNICRDALSAAKYWHFIKLMGRSASHVALECALATRANVTLIGEEVERERRTLAQIVERIATVVRARAEAGRTYGVCLIPEGLIEFIPEIRDLISRINAILHEHRRHLETIGRTSDREEFVVQKLDAESARTFGGLPERIRHQLLLERDSHGNVQVSKIDTEALLVEQVGELLAEWRSTGRFEGTFSVQHHFFGYEGRCAAPSNFDADYTYGLGQVAAALIAHERTGYMGAIRGLHRPPAEWQAAGVPLTSLMQIETRKGSPTPVIGKALVDLDGPPFAALARGRSRWEIEDDYVYPGAIQYFGPPDVAGRTTTTLQLEAGRDR